MTWAQRIGEAAAGAASALLSSLRPGHTNPARRRVRRAHAGDPQGRHLSVRVPVDLLRRAETMARDVDRQRAVAAGRWRPRYTISHLVRELLAQAVDHHEQGGSRL